MGQLPVSTYIIYLYFLRTKTETDCSLFLHIYIYTSATVTGGDDFEPGPYTVSFSPGQPSATLTVLIVDDITTELSEVFMVVISSTDPPSAAAIGSPNMAFITIEDNDPSTY